MLTSAFDLRVILLAPTGRDAELLAGTLAASYIATAIAKDGMEVVAMLAEGAGAVIVAEEALKPPVMVSLAEWVIEQPAWSDTPFIVLTAAGRPTREHQRRAQEMQLLGNVTLIERPARPETVHSSVRTALRARKRQYEIRRREGDLLQANADLEQFAHSASHDLREPLRTIALYSHLVCRTYADVLDEPGRGFLKVIESNAIRMDSLLTDLLRYAHASSIRDSASEAIPAQRALKSALESLAIAITESKAQISIGELPCVRMHESHLAQLFQNLVGNAIKYRHENRPVKIVISAARDGENWIFCVADNGIGIEPDYRKKIFGLFQRLHASSKYPGAGMGLAICDRIIDRYGGRIWVESVPGQGSSFYFTSAAETEADLTELLVSEKQGDVPGRRSGAEID
ncbi:MAG: ATP-binding protein [Acidobacteriota bacterium]